MSIGEKVMRWIVIPFGLTIQKLSEEISISEDIIDKFLHGDISVFEEVYNALLNHFGCDHLK